MNDVNIQDWVGRTEQNTELVSLRQSVGMSAMLDYELTPQAGEPLPPGWHWMFFREMARQ